MNKFEEVDAKDITSGNLNSGKFIARAGNSKITFAKDGWHTEVGPVELDEAVSYQEYIVFTNSGHTYHFKNVTDFVPTTTGFSFTYTGVATGVTRKANFEYTSVAGYALS